jgi:hypothetical protein
LQIAAHSGRGLERADVVGHEGCPGREDRQVDAALVHEPQLVLLDAFAQLVVGNLQVLTPGRQGRVREAGNLPVPPFAEGGGAVV